MLVVRLTKNACIMIFIVYQTAYVGSESDEIGASLKRA